MTIFFIFVAAAVVYGYFFLQYMKKKKAEQEAYVLANPDVAKVFTKRGIADLFGSEAITVTGVNANPPSFFYDGFKEGQGFFLHPGKNVVEVQYARTRPGILYKSVTTTIGPSNQEVIAEAKKSYRLKFDRKNEAYVFEEIMN